MPLLRTAQSLVLAIILAETTAFACRYSVRDTGFVEIGAEPYRLLLGGRTASDVSSLYRQAASATFLDANIEFALADTDSPAPISLTLTSREGRRLTLHEGQEVPTDRTAIVALLDHVALSPFRARVLDDALEAFAVIALIEGTDSRRNAQARATIDAAISHVTQLLPTMPKPVTVPPRVLTLPAKDIAIEKVAVWGLGLDPVPTQEPRAVILFGRGRRIGDPLEGPLITQTTLQERLVMIGQDCECELDRSWLKGPLLPVRWDQERQSAAARVLGFNPENPMIRTEISRIVLRGPADGPRRKLTGPRSALGYDEVPVESVPDSAPLPSDTTTIEGSVTEVLEAAQIPPAPAPPTLDRTERLLWAAILGGALGAGIVGFQRWRRARQEQG
ncbi:MAG: hypothetical protein JNK85_07640 [Verrucomicrobiales bacterium]|nr:hypothetical protein [Verrucomicrobiales bacterium]